jgi:hypothetical protein
VGWRRATPSYERFRSTQEPLITDYRIEIAGPIPAGLATEIRSRFAPTEIRPVGRHVLIRTRTTDQAALRALLGLIWDVGAELHSITEDTPTRFDDPAGRTNP